MVAGGKGTEANGIQAAPTGLARGSQATKVDETMTSLYESLAEKLSREGGRGRLGGARADISVQLLNYREAIQELWLAADEAEQEPTGEGRLEEAVEALRPLFGEPH